MAGSLSPAPPLLSLTFSLRASARRSSRLFSVAVAVDGERLDGTEALRSPADFVYAVIVPTGRSDIELILEVDGISRGNVLVRCEELIQTAESGLPIAVRLPDGIVDVYAEVHEPDNVKHVAGFQVSRRGILNTTRINGLPECVVVISRRRRDGSWVPVYRSAGDLRKRNVGGQLVSMGNSDGSDVAVRVDAYSVGRFGGDGVPVASLMCSLKYLREKDDGTKLPLVDFMDRRAGFCILRTVKTSSTISWFDLDVFAFARGAQDKENLAVVMANDAFESVPAVDKKFRIRAEELRAMAERKQSERLKKRLWFTGVFKILRFAQGMGRMNDTAVQVLQNVERERQQRAVSSLPATPRFI